MKSRKPVFSSYVQVGLAGACALALLSILSCQKRDEAAEHALPDLPAAPTQIASVPNAVNARGVSPLIEAVIAGDQSLLRSMLEAGADPNDPSADRPPLMTAVTEFRDGRFGCNREIVKLLLEYGADPNIPMPLTNIAPINQALRLGDAACATLLKLGGADIGAPAANGETLLDSAVSGAVRTGDFTLIDLPLTWGVDPNVRTSIGTTALMTAVWLDSVEAVRALVSVGADPCLADYRGAERTPLYLARIYGVSRDVILELEAISQCP